MARAAKAIGGLRQLMHEVPPARFEGIDLAAGR